MGLSPSPLCTDEQFLRRAYVDLIGTLPTADEAREFLAACESERNGRMDEWTTPRGYPRSGPNSSIRPFVHSSTQDAEPAPALDARVRLVDRLLERPEYVDYWSMKWGDLLRNNR